MSSTLYSYNLKRCVICENWEGERSLSDLDTSVRSHSDSLGRCAEIGGMKKAALPACPNFKRWHCLK